MQLSWTELGIYDRIIEFGSPRQQSLRHLSRELRNQSILCWKWHIPRFSQAGYASCQPFSESGVLIGSDSGTLEAKIIRGELALKAHVFPTHAGSSNQSNYTGPILRPEASLLGPWHRVPRLYSVYRRSEIVAQDPNGVIPNMSFVVRIWNSRQARIPATG